MDDGQTVPCVADPASWDADIPVSRDARVDLDRVVRLCLTGCPVLAECRAYLATEPPVAGVCAGVYRPHIGEPWAGDIKRGWAEAIGADIAAEQAAERADDETGDVAA